MVKRLLLVFICLSIVSPAYARVAGWSGTFIDDLTDVAAPFDSVIDDDVISWDSVLGVWENNTVASLETDPLAIHVDGSTSPTANIPWGGFDITGMGNITGTDVDISAGTGEYSSTGNIIIGADDSALFVGEDQDASISFTATGLIINASIVAPTGTYIGATGMGAFYAGASFFLGNMDVSSYDITTTGTISDGVLTISDGNLTNVEDISGSDVDINTGTGAILDVNSDDYNAADGSNMFDWNGVYITCANDFVPSAPISLGGNGSPWTNIWGTTGNFGGTVTVDTLTDGTLSINSGSITSAVNGTFSGTVQVDGQIGIGRAPTTNMDVYAATGSAEVLIETDAAGDARPAFYLKNNLNDRAGFFFYGSAYSTAKYQESLRIHLDAGADHIFFTGMNSTVWEAGDIHQRQDDGKITWGLADATDSYIQFGGTNLEVYSSGAVDFLASKLTTTGTGAFGSASLGVSADLKMESTATGGLLLTSVGQTYNNTLTIDLNSQWYRAVITGGLSTDGVAGNAIAFESSILFKDDMEMIFGNASDFRMRWATTGNDHARFAFSGASGAGNAHNLIITGQHDSYSHTVSPDPMLIIHSKTVEETATNQWIGFWHDRTDGNIQVGVGDLNLIPATAVTLGDGGTTNYSKFEADGTLEFNGTATIWNDIQFQVSSARTNPANVAPTWETFTPTTSEYAFSVNDEVDTYANEIPHWWKQGTTGNAHMHITTKAVPAQEQKAQFTVTFAYADSNEVWVEAPLTAELTIPINTTALTSFYLDLGNITLTNYLIEAQMRCRVKRVAKSAGGTEYVGDIFITQVGIHFEEDTIGSRTENGK